MTLNPGTKFPTRRAYVLKMRADARPGELAGRLENLVTGHSREFASGGELLDSIASDLVVIAAEQPEDSEDIRP